MKRKTERQARKELMDYIIFKKMPPQKAREVMRAYIEKRLYEKTKKLH